MATVAVPETKTMLTLPGDAVRQIQWRFADRFDLQMLVQSARGVARRTHISDSLQLTLPIADAKLIEIEKL